MNNIKIAEKLETEVEALTKKAKARDALLDSKRGDSQKRQ
jgi:hypothetical protein